jgi:hypothetical protein
LFRGTGSGGPELWGSNWFETKCVAAPENPQGASNRFPAGHETHYINKWESYLPIKILNSMLNGYKYGPISNMPEIAVCSSFSVTVNKLVFSEFVRHVHIVAT